MVEEAGGEFFLVHVATPLEECERRDRKGLYAKARRGEIPDFTGISSPYEEPEDAAVRVDTTGRTIEDALDDVLEALAETGHLDLHSEPTAGTPAVARRRLGSRAGDPSASSSSAPPTSAAPPGSSAARALAAKGIEFSSAGTHGFDAHPMDEVMAGTLEAADDGVPQPPPDPRDPRAGRPGAHRRGGAPRPSSSRSTRRRCARSSRSASSPRAAQARPDLRGREPGHRGGRAAYARPRPRTTSTTPTGAGMRRRSGSGHGRSTTMLSVIVAALRRGGLMAELTHPDRSSSILAAGFFVGIVVGLTGMGGGALMTPALIFLGVGEAATVVTADLTAAAVYKTGGAIVHKREGSPNMRLAKWLMIGSVPMALLGPHLVAWFADDPRSSNHVLKICIGFALLLRGGDLRPAPLHQPAPRALAAATWPTRTPPSGRSRRCSSARSAACSSASPASAPARSS